MRILITGSAGYLGHQLCLKGIQEKHPVVGIDIKTANISNPNYKEYLCDITLQDKIKDIILSSKPEVVIHSAAALAQFVPNEKRLHEINVDGTKNVISAAFDVHSQKFIFLSSVEVYGIEVPIPCPETAPLNPICQYGFDKVECEQICSEYLQKGMNITIFRPPTITGPGQNEPTLLKQIKSAYEGKTVILPAGGNTRLQMVNIDDVCNAIFLAIGNPTSKGAILNLGSDNVPTLREVTFGLYKHAGKVPKVISPSAKTLRFVVKLLNKLHISPIRPQHLEIALRDYMFDNSLAKKTLGWSPTKDDIKSMCDTYDWYVEQTKKELAK